MPQGKYLNSDSVLSLLYETVKTCKSNGICPSGSAAHGANRQSELFMPIDLVTARSRIRTLEAKCELYKTLSERKVAEMEILRLKYAKSHDTKNVDTQTQFFSARQEQGDKEEEEVPKKCDEDISDNRSFQAQGASLTQQEETLLRQWCEILAATAPIGGDYICGDEDFFDAMSRNSAMSASTESTCNKSQRIAKVLMQLAKDREGAKTLVGLTVVGGLPVNFTVRLNAGTGYLKVYDNSGDKEVVLHIKDTVNHALEALQQEFLGFLSPQLHISVRCPKQCGRNRFRQWSIITDYAKREVVNIV